MQPTLSHLHPLQVEKCESNSRLVVDEDFNGLKGLSNEHTKPRGNENIMTKNSLCALFVFR